MAKNQTQPTDKGQDLEKDLLEKSIKKLELSGYTAEDISEMPDRLIIKTAKTICMVSEPANINKTLADALTEGKAKIEEPLDAIFSRFAPLAKIKMGNHLVAWQKSSSILYEKAGYKLEYAIRFFNPTNSIDYQDEVSKYETSCMDTLEKLVDTNKRHFMSNLEHNKNIEKGTYPSVTVGSVQTDPEDTESLRATLTLKRVDIS